MGLKKTRSTKAANRQEESLEEGLGAFWSDSLGAPTFMSAWV